MPTLSPRRSSRARTTQPTNSSQQAHSTTSSNSSSRNERSTRSHHKNQSPPKSTTPRSRSSEEPEETTRNVQSEPPQTRRRKRDPDEDEEGADTDITLRGDRKLDDGDDDDDEEEEEEEVTRCICGQQEYPGRPIPQGEPPRSNDVNLTTKPSGEDASSIVTTDATPEDGGGLFIQCDICQVWQHGGCVGIMDESMSPENYYCELCRKDLHRVSISSNGQKYSRYLPVFDRSTKTSRASSHSKDFDSVLPHKDRSSRLSALSMTTKRRSTMNSRDAAYDEEEQLRKALEESKADGSINGAVDNGSRKGKRGRGDSEEPRAESNKRQRTDSESPSLISYSTVIAQSHHLDSEDEASGSRVNGGAKRIRSTANRNQRDKELRDREREKERERADAAGRRKGRAERRHGDDSDPSDDFPLSQNAAKEGADTFSQPLEGHATSQMPPDTPPNGVQTGLSYSNRKMGRPPASRRGRIGRNQYTRDRDLQIDHGERDASPRHSLSRDGVDDSSGANGTSAHRNLNGDSGKPSRPRPMNPHRTSMNDMKRRVGAILEFISRTQVEMAGESTPPSGGSSLLAAEMIRSLSGHVPSIMVNGTEGSGKSDKSSSEGDREFAELTSLEMMDVLTRKLVLWQEEYGK